MGAHRPPWVGRAKTGWRIATWVQPGARRSEFAGVHGDCVKIRVQAPAVDNKANAALVRFVAEVLDLRPGQVEIEAGHGSRRKSLLLKTEEEPDWSRFSDRAEI
ncbi:MAG: DUF167 domain-containing protein [Desulfovibrionales bacterium]|nr:DUF167 domain-containing protein [Desulfovibrionales bacterium]